ncbi:trypsin-like peptidase domain-containing protein [Candidatus Kaiserbacteria bacterium]|nr:trypsin-like peptidase domain-containing protein [Candidatus Kaiserbacteria bacterium]
MSRWSRYAPYLFALLLFAVGGLAIFKLLNPAETVRQYYAPAPLAGSPATDAGFSSEADNSTQATSTTVVEKKEEKEPPVAKVAPPPAETTVSAAPVSLPIEASTDAGSLDAGAQMLRGALVNILCYAPAGGRIRSTSGGGIFIDPKGIILTNAHIAQYLLLADQSVSCRIRSGNPAKDMYQASLVYVSPAWLKTNPRVVTEAEADGDGQYDYALLAVTKSMTSEPLPSRFPFISLSAAPPVQGVGVAIASYGAQFLDAEQIRSALYPIVVYGSVKELFTFGTNTADVLALGGSAAAQEGSSGGGVTDSSGKLVGLITTSTVTGETSSRSLNALSATYVRAQYASETGQALDLLLAAPIADSVAAFASRIPELEKIITTGLP